MKFFSEYIYEEKDIDTSLQDKIVSNVENFIKVANMSKKDLLTKLDTDDEFAQEFMTKITSDIDSKNLADFNEFSKQVIYSYLNGNKEINERFVSKEEEKFDENDIHKGDICYTSWGYSMTLVDFYEVIATTPSSITLKELKTKVVKGSAMQGYIMPVIGEYDSHGETVKARKNKYGRYKLKGKYGASVYKWDNKEKYVDRMY
jgi:hypothetical protein